MDSRFAAEFTIGPAPLAAARNEDHSTFSTYTRIVPPQESPTFQAVSSATPNSSVLGRPVSITSRASVTTAPSTQPPETEPRKLPWSSMIRFEPTGRGADPQVSTTVASATPRPALRQSSAALRISSSRASVLIVASGLARSFYHTDRRVASEIKGLRERSYLLATKRKALPRDGGCGNCDQEGDRGVQDRACDRGAARCGTVAFLRLVFRRWHFGLN